MASRQKPVTDLIAILTSNAEMKDALQVSLQLAQYPGIETLEEFYDFLDKILTHVPTENELMASVREFYFVISKSPGDFLRKDKTFNKWMNDFVMSRGDFLDTPESAGCLESFIRNPEYKIDDYSEGPSGWLSYNQFLARQLKPGKRPVASVCDDSVIVSPADSEFKGEWNIAEDSTISVKNDTYSVADLLENSAYRDKFIGGKFTHSFLSITDYHRYHVPVAGVVCEVRKIPATTWVNEAKKPDGSLENIDDVGFQFTHTRAHVIIDSPIGFVAVIPVGMGHISSVHITVDENTSLVKGTEFGYFAFGGSDIIMLFEAGKIEFTAKPNIHYNQGEQIARAINV